MKRLAPRLVYENEEDRRTARIISTLIFASWGTYLFVIFTGFLYQDLRAITVTLAGSAFQFVPMVLLRRGHLRASSLLVVLSVLGTVTFIATVGQGIRDLAIIAFPIVFIFAGLTLGRAFFRLCVGVALVAVIWLTVGEAKGWFVTTPFNGPYSNWLYLVGVVILLLVAALAVDLLAMNMRGNLEQARTEIAQRKQMEEQLRYQGIHDALTGIYNRSFFEEELARLERGREFPITIVMADVDRLKLTNDTLGHAEGDQLLRQAAQVLISAFRAEDILARIGGDEFAALLPSTDSASAEKITERIRAKLAEHNRLVPDQLIQLSLGAATAEKGSLAQLFTLADRRMYVDKAVRRSGTGHSLVE